MNMLINIDVDDLAQAVEFYCSAFDLKVGRRLGSVVVELVGGTAPIFLLGKPESQLDNAQRAQIRDYSRHWTPVHLDVVVDNLEAALERALAAGATAESEIRSHVWGRIVQLADPFGHGLCLIQFEGNGYDEVAAA